MYITDLTSIIYEILLCQLYDLNYLRDLHHAQRCSYVSRQTQYVPTKYQQRHFRWSWLVGDPTSIGSRKTFYKTPTGSYTTSTTPTFFLSFSFMAGGAMHKCAGKSEHIKGNCQLWSVSLCGDGACPIQT